MDKILIIDFGSQYTQLIARRIREAKVYSEIVPFNVVSEKEDDMKGIILSGSPFSVNQPDAPSVDLSRFRNKIPILGICYGAQLMIASNQGKVQSSNKREYGGANLFFNGQESLLFRGIESHKQVWMSHGDTIENLPERFLKLASTDTITNAAFKIEGEETYGIQFHPEVTHSIQGKQIIENFLFQICKCNPIWSSELFISNTIDSLTKKIGSDKVVFGLSGGVDSTVAAMLLHKAIGKNLYCIFINNGLLRKNEFESVSASYRHLNLNLLSIDSSELFLHQLKGIIDPEQKRKIIGNLFITIFDQEAKKIPGVKWLGQGTIYPDRIESVSIHGPSAKIKSHHNVGGLPEKMNLKLVEPLSLLFKDEVRKVGHALNIPETILTRHPFPGPGLAVRILGEVNPENVRILREADDIYISILKSTGIYNQIWQAGAIFLPVKSVGVMGDERTYENVISLRAVVSEDGMTADWFRFPYDILAVISNSIINNVKGVNRVVYDISSKPPATIEWE